MQELLVPKSSGCAVTQHWIGQADQYLSSDTKPGTFTCFKFLDSGTYTLLCLGRLVARLLRTDHVTIERLTENKQLRILLVMCS